jgi:folylpolyglutamate synthase/dihydropteroate synthase
MVSKPLPAHLSSVIERLFRDYGNFIILADLCSSHLLTIRERISVGERGGSVSAALLRHLFDQAKEAIDESIESENEALTQFEVVLLLSCRFSQFLLWKTNVSSAIFLCMGLQFQYI